MGHANDEYNDPGATGPATTPSVPAAALGDRPKSSVEPGVSGGGPGPADGAPSEPAAPDLTTDEGVDAANKEQLEAEADHRDLDVQGTGSGGNVVVGDLRDALKKDNA